MTAAAALLAVPAPWALGAVVAAIVASLIVRASSREGPRAWAQDLGPRLHGQLDRRARPKDEAGWAVWRASGCYVIECGPARPFGRRDVYVGQAENLAKRVHAHLTGHGSGDVYAAYSSGRRVTIRFAPCEASRMNALERRLIARFRAEESFNRTRGGGKRR